MRGVEGAACGGEPAGGEPGGPSLSGRRARRAGGPAGGPKSRARVLFFGPGAGGARNLNAQLDNQGTITLTANTTTNKASVDHVNSGTITIADGHVLTVTQSGATPTFTHTGTIAIGAGAVCLVDGGSLIHDPGTTTASGSTWAPSSFGSTSTVGSSTAACG